jgi:hypothetical protein
VTNPHIEELKRARERLVEQRRGFAKQIAGPFERGKTDDARAKIIESQAIIDALDRAIEDEGKIDFRRRQEEDAKRD